MAIQFCQGRVAEWIKYLSTCVFKIMANQLWRMPKIFFAVIFVLIVGIMLTALNVYELHRMQREHMSLHQDDAQLEVGKDKHKLYYDRPIYWIQAKHMESGYLKHVVNVFEKIGYISRGEDTHWDVLWSHDYPFSELKSALSELKSHQKVNHFPGTGYITNKVSLATSNLKYVPRAFRLPSDKAELFSYAKSNPEKLWVQKSNNHRGIRIQKLDEMDLKSDGTFIQEFIQKPLLINGRKFDIGVYAVLTSINPLRVYMYEGDILLRFCTESYHPFNPANINKYVIGDDYTPTWELSDLKKLYNGNKLTFKETFNAWLQSKDKDPELIWSQIRSAIAGVYRNKENNLIRSSINFKSTRNFFEMVRFDFVIDEDYNVYIMEANMSPNLSSAHFKENEVLYEHVVFNLLSVVGVAHYVHSSLKSSSNEVKDTLVSDREIMVYGELCSSNMCSSSCDKECQLCNFCVSEDQKLILKDAYQEHLNRQNCRRLIPEPITQNSKSLSVADLSSQNYLMSLWFQGKCKQDVTWCH
ncbi:Tubulin polyglutamylase TTLL6 [Nymphon striatum]|nr:Tubulin polyglutamylase TTLL6 [Nymphon striatum]